MDNELNKAVYNSIVKMSSKVSTGMKSVLSKGLAKPIDINGIISKTNIKIETNGSVISLSTQYPYYAYFTKYGRGKGLMPPDAPIRNWCSKHGVPLEAVYPIRKKMAEEGSKRHRENNPLDFTLPFYRMIEMIQKTLAVNIIEDETWQNWGVSDTANVRNINIKL